MSSHERVSAIININAFEHNLDEIKRIISPGTCVMAVIKADGYGHGAKTLAKVMESRDEIWGYGTATVEEALELRRAGCVKPVLILGHVFPGDLAETVRNDIRTAVYTYEDACLLNEAAAAQKKTAQVHIKLDTGMGRIGFKVKWENALSVQKIAGLSNISIEGLFTHFSRSDEKDKDFTRRQMEEYIKFSGWLSELGVNIPLHHVSNSAAITDIPQYDLDMVRAGIILYGLWPSDQVLKDRIDLRPVMELKSHVAFIKETDDKDPISYGGTYISEGKRMIATIPVGYGDGYPRSLSNRGCVLIKGRRAPIRGRICMDQFMADVTDIPGVAQGDEVTLIGKDGNEMITMEELSALSGRFNYEFACCLSKRIPRICRGSA